MKKKILCMIVIVIILCNNLYLYANGNPSIKDATLSVDSVYQGRSVFLSININTLYETANSHVNAEIVTKSGMSLTPKITSNMYGLNNGNTNIRMSIPGYLEVGEYYIKVTLYSYINNQNYTTTKNLKFIIKALNEEEDESESESIAEPVISNIITEEANLIEGALDGLIIIAGSNFSTNKSDNSISIIDNLSGDIVINNIIPVDSNYTYVKFEIPLELGQGVYKVKLTSKNKSVISDDYFTIQGKKPIIEDITYSSNVSLIYGAISGDLTVVGENLWDESEEVFYKILNENNEVVSSISDYLTTNNNKVSFTIPKGLGAGKYFIQGIVNRKNVISTESMEIMVAGSSNPVVSSIDITNAILKEGNIKGFIIINGQNLIPNPSVEYVDMSNNLKKASIIGSTNQTLKISIPNDISEGVYRLKVSVLDKNVISDDLIIIDSDEKDIEDFANRDIQVIQTNNSILKSDGENFEFSKENLNEVLDSITINNKETQLLVEIPESAENKEIDFKEDIIDKLINKKAGINLNSSFGGVTLPFELIKSFKNNEFKVILNKLDNSVVQNLIKGKDSMKDRTLKGNIISVEIKGKNGESLDSFDNRIKISSKVDVLDNENVEKYCLYYFEEAKNEWTIIGGKYDYDKKEIYSYVDHLTKFAVFDYNKKFKDIQNDYWANEYIEVLSARNIINGMDENNFMPELTINRAQFVTLLVKALNLKTYGYGNKFGDVKKDDWFRPYVESAEISGIVSGVGNFKFDPEGKITREQMAVMIVNAYKYVNNEEIQEEKTEFVDSNEISDWAISSVKAAYKLGLIKGMENLKYVPKADSKRAQAATVIYRLLKEFNAF
ncbi:MAG: S-layer homology domain-containing protein [Clostridiales bacterium]